MAKIERIYVATELATTESSVVHDIAGCAKAGAYNNVVSGCVATEEAMHARQTKPGAHDRGARATGEFYRDREFSIATGLDSDKKKKTNKKSRDFGCHRTTNTKSRCQVLER